MLTTPQPYLITQLQSHSISPGNPDGERAAIHREQRPEHYISLQAGETATIADIEGPGMLRSFWFTLHDLSPTELRSYILRIYWDDNKHPSVEAPFGDFFGLAYGRTAHNYTPYLCYQIDHPELKGKYYCSSYRFFVQDPIYFRKGLRVEHDTRGPISVDQFQGPRSDDWCSTVYWYQHLTDLVQPPIPRRDERIDGVGYQPFEKGRFESKRQFFNVLAL